MWVSKIHSTAYYNYLHCRLRLILSSIMHGDNAIIDEVPEMVDFLYAVNSFYTDILKYKFTWTREWTRGMENKME